MSLGLTVWSDSYLSHVFISNRNFLFSTWNIKCRAQLTIFEFSCLTVIDKLELFDLTETEEAVIFPRKIFKLWIVEQGRHGRFLAGKTATVAATLPACSRRILFRKIQVRPRSCRSYLSWRPCRGCLWFRNAETPVKLARNPKFFQIPNDRNWILVF